MRVTKTTRTAKEKTMNALEIPQVRGRVKFGDCVRLYGLPGVYEVWGTTSESYDFYAKPLGDSRRGGFPVTDASVVEINGRATPCLSCPLVPPAKDYPHLPEFDYSDGPQRNAWDAVAKWRMSVR